MMNDKVEVPKWMIKAVTSWESFDDLLDAASEKGSRRDAYDELTGKIREFFPEWEAPDLYEDYYNQRRWFKDRKKNRVVSLKMLKASTKKGFVDVVYEYKRKGNNHEQAYSYAVNLIRGEFPEWNPPFKSARSMQESLNSKRRKR